MSRTKDKALAEAAARGNDAKSLAKTSARKKKRDDREFEADKRRSEDDEFANVRGFSDDNLGFKDIQEQEDEESLAKTINSVPGGPSVPENATAQIGGEDTTGSSEEPIPDKTAQADAAIDEAIPKKKQTTVMEQINKGNLDQTLTNVLNTSYTPSKRKAAPTGRETVDKEQFDKQRASLVKMKNDLREEYRDLKKTKQWASIAEKFSHALLGFAAAQQGKKDGVDLSNLKMTPTDWDKQMSNDLAELNTMMEDARQSEAGVDRKEKLAIADARRTEDLARRDYESSEASRRHDDSMSMQQARLNLQREAAQHRREAEKEGKDPSLSRKDAIKIAQREVLKNVHMYDKAESTALKIKKSAADLEGGDMRTAYRTVLSQYKGLVDHSHLPESVKKNLKKSEEEFEKSLTKNVQDGGWFGWGSSPELEEVEKKLNAYKDSVSTHIRDIKPATDKVEAIFAGKTLPESPPPSKFPIQMMNSETNQQVTINNEQERQEASGMGFK